MSFAYLSIPYNSKNPDPEKAREERAARMELFWLAVGYLTGEGIHVVSPMTLEPALTRCPQLPYDWDFWREYSLKMMAISTGLIVLQLPGWEESTGVAGEIAEARALGKNVTFLDPSIIMEWAKP